jgi:prepilin-type N-terminal cleavage/methylation domain-containing protein
MIPRQRGFTLLELMIVVAIIGILASIAIPNFRAMINKAKRAEVPANVSGIYIAEIAFDAIEDEFLSMSPNPSTPPGKELRDFDPSGTGWNTLGWKPDGQVRGTYSATASVSTFTVYGVADVDGDSVLCQYTASESQAPILRAGDENIY